jgi:predicted nucleotidyltransferase
MEVQQVPSEQDIPADQVVESVVKTMCTNFGGRILSIYAGGSYSRGQIGRTSDIDMTIVFVERVSDAEYDRFMALRDALQRLSPFRLDIWPESERKLKSRPASAAVRSARCVYGEAFLHTVPAAAIDPFAMSFIHKAMHYMAVLRGRPSPYRAPVNAPDADDPFYGYTRYGEPDGPDAFKEGTRIIISMATCCATALLATDARLEVGSKQESLDCYAQSIGGQWAGYIAQLHDTLNLRLGYRVPTDAAEHASVRALLARLPAFENDTLARFKPVILRHLRGDDPRMRTLALVTQKNIQFLDDDTADALDRTGRLENSDLYWSVKALFEADGRSGAP